MRKFELRLGDLKGYNMGKIIMAHGAGGKTGAELMSNIFGKHFKKVHRTII